MSALHVAAASGHPDVVKDLLVIFDVPPNTKSTRPIADRRESEVRYRTDYSSRFRRFNFDCSALHLKPQLNDRKLRLKYSSFFTFPESLSYHLKRYKLLKL